MSKKLKSFHKLFFIVFFSFLFSSIVGSGNTPDLPNRIAPELEKIEALPRRTKPAELNIEVTKIKSEPLEEVYIDRKNKNIYVDFSKKIEQTLRGVKDAEELEKKYDLIVSESVQGNSEVNGRSKSRNKSNSQVMSYEVVEYQGKKVLKIPYENEPEKFYISVQESGKLVKVYGIDVDRATLIKNKNILEKRTVIINLKNGIETYLNKILVFNLNGELTFDSIGSEQGTSSSVNSTEVAIIKDNGEFINSFPEETKIVIKSDTGKSNEATKTSSSKSGDIQLFLDNQNPIPQDGFVFDFYKDGELSLRFQQLGSTGRKTYKFYITHESSEGIKEHTLIINSGIQAVKRREVTVIYHSELQQGYDNIESTFDTRGIPNRLRDMSVKIHSENTNGEFITGLGNKDSTYITIQEIDINTGANIGAPVSKGREVNSSDTIIPIETTNVVVSFLRNGGELSLKMKNLDNSKSYKYKITHRNSNSSSGTIVMEDILNISSESIEKSEVDLIYTNKYNYTWYKFDLEGNITEGAKEGLEVIKLTDNFIKTMKFSSNVDAPKIIATEQNTGKSVELVYEGGVLKGILNFGNGMNICLLFSPDGHFEFNVGGTLIRKEKYTVKLEHRDGNSVLYKRQILHIQDAELRNIIERKEVTVSYVNGYQTWLAFDKNGKEIYGAAEVKKHNFQDGFIGGFEYDCKNGDHAHDENILKINSPSIDKIKYDLRTDGGMYLDADITTTDGANIVLRYYCNPLLSGGVVLHLYMSKLPESGNKYRFYITHMNEDGSVKEHILNIGDCYELEEKEVSIYLNGVNNSDINFDINGKPNNPNVKIKKHNFIDGFITGFKQDECLYPDYHNIKVSAENEYGNSEIRHEGNYTYVYITISKKSGVYDYITLKYYCNGESMSILSENNSNNVNRIYITHTQKNKVKEHTLNIYPSNSGIKRTSNLKNYEIIDSDSFENNFSKEIDFGNLEMIINDVNIFYPALALGNQSSVETNGWGFSSSSTILPNREKVEARYETQYQVPISVEMYFVGPNEDLIISRGVPTTFLGKIGGTPKNITANLKGKLTINKNFKDIVEEFRQGTETELVLTSKEKEQVSFVIGENQENKYSAPTTKSIDISVVNEKYPNIILKQAPIEKEDVELILESDFDFSKDIVFTEAGVTGQGIKPLVGSFLKSLWYKGSFILNNDTNYRDISADGNSNGDLVELSKEGDLNKKLNLEIQYKGRYPWIKINNTPEAGEYNLKIQHYNYGTVATNNGKNVRFAKSLRKYFNLKIIIKEPTLVEPSMAKTHNLKELVIEDDIKTETYKIVGMNNSLVNMGTLTMEQTKSVPTGDIFPLIALGNQSEPNGWEFMSSQSTSMPNRETITQKFTNNLFGNPISLSLEMSLLEKEIVPIGATKIRRGNPATVFGAHSPNTQEKIDIILNGNVITNKNDIDTIIKNFREKVAREMLLTPEGSIETQISYVIGDKGDKGYTAPTIKNIGTADKKIESIKYPNIKIIKPLLEEKITLTIPKEFLLNTPIKFNSSGVNVGVTATSDKQRYLKSLHYNSLFNINDSLKKNISEQGGSESYDITLNNGQNQLVLKVQYGKRYPTFEILNTPEAGTYTLNIKHFDPSGLERQNYMIDIEIEPRTDAKDFEVTSSMRDIIIIPPQDGNLKKVKVEYPNNWIKIQQLTNNSKVFPVIGINKPKWVITTLNPLNPVNERPMSSLQLGETILDVPVNIRETPYQNAEKFFVYSRGDMTDRNIAVGAYTKTQNMGENNIVQVNFQMFLDESHLKEIIEYAKSISSNEVEIPYVTKEDNKIYAIKGLINSENKFVLEEGNVLSGGTINFPKIKVLKDTSLMPSNTATLNFINPVPKSNGDISGTFDVVYGVVAPNNLEGYTHPSSLSVTGVTQDWYGFTVIPEYHKVNVYIGGNNSQPVKTFTTTELGDIKGVQVVSSGENEYILMKGKNSPLAIGVSKWNFNNIKDKITLEHLNSSGRVLHKDIYEINIEAFSPNKYLDVTNSSFMEKVGATQTLNVTANARQDFIDLGTLKLQNYQKDITKTSEEPIGVQIKVNNTPIILKASDGTSLIGNLKFDNEKTNISNPNEISNLRFILSSESVNNISNLVGKTFTITDNNGLVKISGAGKNEIILKKLIIILKDGQAGKLPNMSFVSTITDKTIKESELGSEGKKLTISGKMTLRQLDGGQGNSVPAIALGLKSDWEINNGSRTSGYIRNPLNVEYKIGNESIFISPELINFNTSVDNKMGTDGNEITNNQIKLYLGKNNLSTLTALTYVTKRNTRTERITTGLALNISKEELPKIKEAIKNISGDRIELKAIGLNAKIAYIHAKDRGTTGSDFDDGKTIYIPTANPTLANSFAYETLPSIFIEKENLYKNLEINLLPTYPMKDEKEEIIFNNSNRPTYPDGKVTLSPADDNRVMEGLDYKHKIRLTLPGGKVKEYETLENGSIIIKEIIEKNGKSITLNISYISGKEVQVWVTNRNGIQYYDLVLQHIDPSGDVRRTTTLRINSNLEGSTSTKQGEMDLTISSRYNATDGQLNSSPLVITADGVKCQTEVLDLKLLNGDLPEAPENKFVFIDELEIPKNILNKVVTLENGKATLKVTRKDNGDLEIKPVSWNYNTITSFVLTYKNTTKNITNQYKFNVKCPEFFVASAGVLDFGKLYKFGNPQDKTVTTNIELRYNTNVTATYTLDISQGDLDVEDKIFKNWLYLDDNKTLLVKNLSLGEEVGKGTTERTLPLTGTIHGPSMLKASEGEYEKTIQILIHVH
ncbi:hypothetical protein VSU16_07085 [Cetobacterium somerae]|uniref:hypothetical protein n=1 Tax=Cetobacterium somerae TaxID=188913 RepID=UPI002E7C0FCE|nr:hypothetical protein [Cetobacterium somerae]WVJ00575.1 hypothetical protein VSU16_07085 [Cetobacterium somerae]